MGTEKSLYQSIETVLVARKWDGDAQASYVFARKQGDNTKSESVKVSSKFPEEFVREGIARTPFAIIRPGLVMADREEPQFKRIMFAVVIGVSPQGIDPTGIASTIGGHKTGGSTSSKGRGILEVSTDVESAIGTLDRDNSVAIVCRLDEANDPDFAELPELSIPLLMRQLNFIAEI